MQRRPLDDDPVLTAGQQERPDRTADGQEFDADHPGLRGEQADEAIDDDPAVPRDEGRRNFEHARKIDEAMQPRDRLDG